jgi:transcriptional regulator with XRE-family HTH domain
MYSKKLDTSKKLANYFSKNLAYLRKVNNLSMADFAPIIGMGKSIIGNYEKGTAEPSISTMLRIVQYFGHSLNDMMLRDLSKGVHGKDDDNVHLTVHPSVHPSGQEPIKKYIKQGASKGNPSGNLTAITPTVVTQVVDPKGNILIPLTDIKAAAGGGYINVDDLTTEDFIHLPRKFLKYKNTQHLCVRAKGPSMTPTVQDGSWLPISLLDRGEWANMPDKQCFVVVDNEGKTYFKRVKNRLESRGQITLMSDNPDKVNYGNFDLKQDEIQSIWFVELGLIFRLGNVHDQYFGRLDQLEESMSNLTQEVARLKIRYPFNKALEQPPTGS